MLYRPTPAITGLAAPGFPELIANADGLFDFAPNQALLKAFADHGVTLEEVAAAPEPDPKAPKKAQAGGTAPNPQAPAA